MKFPVMSDSLETVIQRIQSMGDEYCQNQMYLWPGFDLEHPDPAAFFAARGIEFDGDLFIRYRVKETFHPMTVERIADEERIVGAVLPQDFKTLLEVFGEFHLPGPANIFLRSPAHALEITRNQWSYEDRPPRVLAISSYNQTSDGNSIGFLREGNTFQEELFEFNHERRPLSEETSFWTKKLNNSLADFILDHLDRHT